MPKTTVVAAKSECGGEGRGGGAWQSIRGGETRRRRRRGAAKLGWGGKRARGGAKKKERGAKREHWAHSVFWLQRNPSGTKEGGGEGFRGAEEESILLNSHASWRRRGTRRKGRARA